MQPAVFFVVLCTACCVLCCVVCCLLCCVQPVVLFDIFQIRFNVFVARVVVSRHRDPASNIQGYTCTDYAILIHHKSYTLVNCPWTSASCAIYSLSPFNQSTNVDKCVTVTQVLQYPHMRDVVYDDTCSDSYDDSYPHTQSHIVMQLSTRALRRLDENDLDQSANALLVSLVATTVQLRRTKVRVLHWLD